MNCVNSPVSLVLWQSGNWMFTDYFTIFSKRQGAENLQFTKAHTLHPHPLSTCSKTSPLTVWLHYPANVCFLPCPTKGGPLLETPCNKSSRLLLAALTLGFPHSKCCLPSICPPCFLSCLFVKKIKIWERNVLLSAVLLKRLTANWVDFYSYERQTDTKTKIFFSYD